VSRYFIVLFIVGIVGLFELSCQQFKGAAVEGRKQESLGLGTEAVHSQVDMVETIRRLHGVRYKTKEISFKDTKDVYISFKAYYYIDGKLKASIEEPLSGSGPHRLPNQMRLCIAGTESTVDPISMKLIVYFPDLLMSNGFEVKRPESWNEMKSWDLCFVKGEVLAEVNKEVDLFAVWNTGVSDYEIDRQRFEGEDARDCVILIKMSLKSGRKGSAGK